MSSETNPTKNELLEQLKSSIETFSDSDQALIMKAYKLAEKQHSSQKRASGEEYIIHPLNVAINLVKLNGDRDMIIAGLLHDVVEDTDTTLEQLRADFGNDVAMMVDGVTKISKMKTANILERKAETIRKMLLAMIRDIRVIIVKLADRLHNMSTLQYVSREKAVRIANETIDIYSQLAGKIGMNVVKDTLENYALKALHPDIYNQIESYITTKASDVENMLENIKKSISMKLTKNTIPFTIKTRQKHYYSIYCKMKKNNKKIDEIYDIFGVRVITDTVESCYVILGMVHAIWQPITGRFKDYISHPKANGYRSLHTTVIINRKAIEIQIRTKEMDEINEYGVAAHWFYKKGNNVKTQDLTWLKQLEDLHSLNVSYEEYYNAIRNDILKDEIYVFTPKGELIELPQGATPLDFAYKIHTSIGDRCHGAKVNGAIVALNTELPNGSIVEIQTGKLASPKPQWLHYAKTPFAQRKIRHSLSLINQELSIKQPKQEPDKSQSKTSADKTLPPKAHQERESTPRIEIDGQKNLLFSIARCCNPTPEDDIVGFVSRGRGIIIHKTTCHCLKNINEFDKRKIEVNWTK